MGDMACRYMKRDDHRERPRVCRLGCEGYLSSVNPGDVQWGVVHEGKMKGTDHLSSLVVQYTRAVN